MLPDQIFTIFNTVEAVLWFFMALYIFYQLLKEGRKGKYFKILAVAGTTFIAFGLSDLIELQTGAWWRPLGLLVLKAGCLCVFFLCYLAYRRIKKEASSHRTSHS